MQPFFMMFKSRIQHSMDTSRGEDVQPDDANSMYVRQIPIELLTKESILYF